MNTKPVHDFDSIAFLYDTLAALVFGKSIRHAQLATIGYIPDGATVLIMGGGTGWYLKELLAQKKLHKVVYLEASKQMMDLTRKKLAGFLSEPTGSTTLELRLGTEEAIEAGENFDIVITHFFLDIFAPICLQKVMERLNKALKEDGLWLIADFRLVNQQTGIYHWWKKALIKSMYLFFRVVSHISAKDLPQLESSFSCLDMQLITKRSFYAGLIFSAIYKKKKQAYI
jgi:spermidine synthase